MLIQDSLFNSSELFINELDPLREAFGGEIC